MFSLGQLQLKSNLFLSPWQATPTCPSVLVIREIGGVDLCTTDLVNARSLIEQNPKALKLIETNQQDSPLSVQLFGGVKEEMRDASIILEGTWSRFHRCQYGLPGPQGHQDRGRGQHDE